MAQNFELQNTVLSFEFKLIRRRMWRSSCLPLTLDLALDLSLDLALDVEVDLDLDLGACLAFDQLGCGGAAVLGGHHPARQRLQFLVEL